MKRSSEHAYEELIRLSKEAALLESCIAHLHWDERTHMPKAGSENRAQQLASLTGMTHQRRTAPEIGDLLSQVEESELVDDALSIVAVNVREIRRQYDRLTRVPRSLVEEQSRVMTLGSQAWVEARATSDFQKFRPYLAQIVDLKRQEGEALEIGDTPYDALLDDREPGETSTSLARLFIPLQKELVDLLHAIADSGRKPDVTFLSRDYPADGQERLGKAAATAIGIDFNAARLDVTTHPFCARIGPGDVRITTRYDAPFPKSLFSTLHESGHALYNQGLDPGHYGTPRGQAVSAAIHESQSRLWENFVGRSRGFWQYFLPKAQDAFPKALKDVTVDNFYSAINKVKPSFIRVEADEVTYNLHIILRFDIEQALIGGDLLPADLPGAWNEKFGQLFDLIPPNDSQGCLQDMHWSQSYGWGYFPTYALGNLYAAQFFAAACEDLGDLNEHFATGQFESVRTWLNEKIHSQGMRYRAGELVEKVTGHPLGYQPLIDYLKAKFEKLYNL